MEKYIRVVMFLHKIVTELVAQFLESKYQPDNFQTFLLNQRHSLFHLYCNKTCCCCACGNNVNLPRIQVIKGAQFNKLFDKRPNVCHETRTHSCCYTAASNVQISELDVTLAIAILKNCFETSLTQQEKKWLDDIRITRNEISHLTMTSGDISEDDFRRMWSTLDNSTINLANVFQQGNCNDIKFRIQQLRYREVLASNKDCMEILQLVLFWKSQNEENIIKTMGQMQDKLERIEARFAKTGLPAIQIQQSTFKRTCGSKALIPCTISSDSTITNVYWVKHSNNDTIQIKNGDSGYQGITPTIPSLIFNCVALDDEGIYICHVENAAGNNTSYPVTLTVNGALLDITIHPTSAEIIQGKNQTIKCFVSGIPPATSITWQFTPNGGIMHTLDIEDCDGKYTGGSIQNPSLTVTNFQPADAGSYVCLATNFVGKSSSTSTSVLTCARLLDITIGPTSADIIQGRHHTIKCSVSGIPSATSITWQFTSNDGVMHTLDAGDYDGKYTGGSTQNPFLTVTNFQPADAGAYVCSATNAVGTSTCNFPSVLSCISLPAVHIPQRNYSETYGNQVVIPCSIESNCTVTDVYWKRYSSNGTLRINNGDSGYQGGSSTTPSLIINAVKFDDGGKYKCHAINAAGKSTSNTATLRINGELLGISIFPAEAYIIPGNNHTIQCTVIGKPSATSIKWKFTPNGGNQHSLNIGFNGKYTGGSTQNPSLTIKNFQSADAGSYVCCASNAVGTSSSNHHAVLKYRSIPKVQILQNSYIETYGNQVIIPCNVESDSIITDVYWKKYSNNSSVRIKNGDRGYKGSSPSSPLLVIDCVTLDDAGTYICHVKNAAGEGISNSATLTVNGKLLDISVSPAVANIIHGNNHTIQCIVTGIPSATSIAWLFTPNGGTQHSLNIGGCDGKYTGGSTQYPSLTVTNFQSTDEGSYVCCASNSFGTSFSRPPTVLNYTRRSDGNYVETYNRIDGMRISGYKCRKTALSYSFLVYTALRGSISLREDYSNVLREIAKTITSSDVFVNSPEYILERKLVPDYLTKMDNFTYSPRDNVVVKAIIQSFGSQSKECLLEICSFKILFDHVRPKKENTNSDFFEVDARTMAMAFVKRMQCDASDIGEYIAKLGEEINGDTLKTFVNNLGQCQDITFYRMDSFLDGLTKNGTDFDVFRQLPTLYDAFNRKVDTYENTIFHYIVALYSTNEKYKLYMQHFCEKKFVLLQLENCDRYTAIDFASLLGRNEVIEFVISRVRVNRQLMTKRIFEMVKTGVETWRVDNLIKISIDNVSQGNRGDYEKILHLIGLDSDSQFANDLINFINLIPRLIELFTDSSTSQRR